MNALQALNRRISARNIRTSAAIRAERASIKEPQLLDAMYVELSRLLAKHPPPARPEPEVKFGKLVEHPQLPEAPEVATYRATIAAFETENAAALARARDLDLENAEVTQSELHTKFDALCQAFITTEAEDWRLICETLEKALIYRAAKGSALDQMAAKIGAPSRSLSVGYPARITHPDSVNVPALAKHSEPREIYQAISALATELLAKMNR
jgi:hypothetical protein